MPTCPQSERSLSADNPQPCEPRPPATALTGLRWSASNYGKRLRRHRGKGRHRVHVRTERSPSPHQAGGHARRRRPRCRSARAGASTAPRCRCPWRRRPRSGWSPPCRRRGSRPPDWSRRASGRSSPTAGPRRRERDLERVDEVSLERVSVEPGTLTTALQVAAARRSMRPRSSSSALPETTVWSQVGDAPTCSEC